MRTQNRPHATQEIGHRRVAALIAAVAQLAQEASERIQQSRPQPTRAVGRRFQPPPQHSGAPSCDRARFAVQSPIPTALGGAARESSAPASTRPPFQLFPPIGRASAHRPQPDSRAPGSRATTVSRGRIQTAGFGSFTRASTVAPRDSLPDPESQTIRADQVAAPVGDNRLK